MIAVFITEMVILFIHVIIIIYNYINNYPSSYPKAVFNVDDDNNNSNDNNNYTLEIINNIIISHANPFLYPLT